MNNLAIKEKALVDRYGDTVAISVNLLDVKDFILKNFPTLKVSVHHEDYDEYGCEHYVLIEGVCASIRIEKNYGGMFFPADFLECFLRLKNGSVLKSTIENNYAKNIKMWLDENIKFLSDDSFLPEIVKVPLKVGSLKEIDDLDFY